MNDLSHLSDDEIARELVARGYKSPLPASELSSASDAEIDRELRSRQIPSPSTEAPRTPSGIGGWLILPAIGLVLSPLMIIGGLLVTFKIWNESIGALELDYPGAYVVITAQLIMGGAFWCFVLYVAVLFFTKKKMSQH